MISTEVIIVGGGPAGAACAGRLRQAGVDCLVLDQHAFPRLKPCAGWIQPEVAQTVGLSAEEYPGSFTTFDRLHLSLRGLNLTLRTRQHAIRRIEFDDWLLRRSGALVRTHTVRNIAQVPGGYCIDDEYNCRTLVGAGGTYCPVYRTLFKPSFPRAHGTLIAAMEEEFPYPYTDDQCRLWFLDNGLPGYSWYVPKANGYVNVGVGGKAEEMVASKRAATKQGALVLRDHWRYLIEKLAKLGLVRDHIYHPVAHSYYLRQRLPQIYSENAYLVGDAMGLSTLDMGEGIGPAIHSGIRAADAIIHQAEYQVDGIQKYSLVPGVLWESITAPFRGR
jgi:menaquinone-9 beta-reductase